MANKITDPDPKFITGIETKKLLSLGSQMKRITDVPLSQVQDLYDRHHKNFKASWFSFLISIKANPDSDVKDLAELRNVSSSAVSQVVKELINEGLVSSKTTKESRSKMLRITEAGEEALLKISPELKQVEEALINILGGDADNLLKNLDKLEAGIKEKALYKRVPAQIKLETYCDSRAKDFERLNLEWFEKDFRLEDYDKKLLQDPKTYIIDKGGEIFFLVDEAIAVGTVALIKHSDKTIEISKMGVTDSYKGWGLGNLLMETCINYARERKYQEIIILTNSKLVTAVKLYKNFGFKDMPVSNSDKAKYGDRADLGFSLFL